MFLTSNKVLAKRLLRSSGLPTPDWVAIEAGSPRCSGRIEGRAVVKSVWEEASVGLDDHSVVDGGEIRSLAREMAVRAEGLGGEAFAEAYVEGREFNLSVLGGPSGAEVLPIAEIRFVDYAPGRPRLVGYRAKWDADSFEYHHTPRCFDFPPADAPLLGRLEELALACWRLFALRGYARVDFRVDAEGCPWILEVNANPCLSPDAGFLAAADRAGLGRTDVVGRILADTAGSVEEKREARDDVPHPSRL
jgi:D-alanine-D-alanine ligase